MANEAQIADRVAASVMAATFRMPLFTSGRSQKRLDKVMPILEQAVADKHIWNVDYKTLKEGLNRAYENSRDEIRNTHKSIHPADTMSPEDWKALSNQERGDLLNEWRPSSEIPYNLHQLPGFLKKLKKYRGELKREYEQWAESWMPYAQVVKDLKPYIEKGRKPDPNKPVKERYEAPRTSTGGVMMVKAALKKVVDSQARKLVQEIKADYLKWAEKFLDEREETESIYDLLKGVQQMVVRKLVEDSTGMVSYRPGAPREYAMKSDADQIAGKMAEEVVTDMVENYILKNTNKIGSVVERKGGLENIKVVSGELRGWGFRGEMICRFSDETQFVVRNKVVTKVSPRGQWFAQFPTTFHDVTWPDGNRRSMLSEKQMNEEWAKA